MFIRIFLFMILSNTALAHQAPIGKKERIGLNLGLQKEVILDKIDSAPVGLSSSDIAPPLITVKASYQPNYSAVFQPDAKIDISLIDGEGQYLYLQAGGWFDFPKFHVFFGGELFTTLSGGRYDETVVDNFGTGYYVKGAMPLGIFYPSLELRFRKINDAEVANRDGVTTYTGYGGDTIVRPALNVDLSIVKIWGAYTYYKVGNSAIASDGFGIGLNNDPFHIYSAGVGFNYGPTEIWIKAHQLTGINDEVAHMYKVPQIYPDFLMAKQTASVEVQWQF